MLSVRYKKDWKYIQIKRFLIFQKGLPPISIILIHLFKCPRPLIKFCNISILIETILNICIAQSTLAMKQYVHNTTHFITS